MPSSPVAQISKCCKIFAGHVRGTKKVKKKGTKRKALIKLNNFLHQQVNKSLSANYETKAS